MNVRRIFANAVARRVAARLVAAALAWLGLSEAFAAESDLPCRAGQGCDQGTAYVAANDASAIRAAMNPSSARAEVLSVTHLSSGTYQAQVKYYSASGGNLGTQFVNFFYNVAKSCSALPSLTSTFLPRGGSIGCLGGCEYVWHPNGDGTSTARAIGTVCTNERMPQTCTGDYHWNAYLNVCEPNAPECEGGQAPNSLGICQPEPCPAGMKVQVDGTCKVAENECPPGNLRSPAGECLPGDGQCAAGEARRDNGTCGKDSDGDGKADEDDDNPDNDPDRESASGGDTCNAPPACSGGAIACMQVKIQWRIDCNTRRNRNVAGGSCAAMPVCTGEKCDALEYAQLLQQWRATCALEKIAAKGDGTGGGGGDAGVVDLLTGPGSVNSDAGGGDSLDDGNPWADEGEEYEPDASGYGWSRSCPSPPSFTLPGGKSVQINLTPLCNWVSLGGSLVLILAGLLSLRIVSGGNA